MAETRRFDPNLTKKIAILGMLAGLSYALVAVFHTFPPVAAGFLRYDPKDIIITFAGFLYGPLYSVVISVVVSFLEMITISTTGWWGFLMNVVSTCAFACTASLIYWKKRDFWGAVIGLASAVIFTTGVMIVWNWLITPIYMKVPQAKVVAMLPTVFLPFNLLKTALNAALVMLLYKPLTRALKAADLVPAHPEGGEAPKKNVVVSGIIVSAIIMITSIILIVLWQKYKIW